MRLLSSSEVSARGIKNDIPIELSASYFPVTLRAVLVRDGETISPMYASHLRTYGSSRHISHETMVSVMENARHILGARDTFAIDPKSESTYKIEARGFDWRSFDFKKGHMDNIEINQPVLFPIDHLLFEPQLKEWKITPEPGYLYFGCEVELYDAALYQSQYGSRYLSEYIPSFLREGEGAHSKKQKIEPNEYPFTENYVGPIGDVIHATNSKIIHEELIVEKSKSNWDNQFRFTKKYILQTPIEFPQGFVHETARVLSNSPSLKAIAKKFSALIRASEVESTHSSTKKESGFPLGEPDLVGPDVSWKKSKDPWFVQMILLARLFGGKFWNYSLGVISARMGKEIPITSYE